MIYIISTFLSLEISSVYAQPDISPPEQPGVDPTPEEPNIAPPEQPGVDPVTPEIRREGDGFYNNNQCGNRTCAVDEVCQKTFGGFDQSQDNNPNNNDVLPPSQVPPEVNNNSNTNDGLGSILNGITGQSGDAAIYDRVQYKCVPAQGIPGQEQNKYFDGSDEEYNEADLFRGAEDPGVPVNIINRDALPVDIFNPNPLPTQIVSPNPIPVTVVDDLALYQQKELIDKPLANKQKKSTIGEINKSVRDQISEQKLIQSPADIRAEAVRSGAFDEETGSIPVAERAYQEFDSAPTPEQFDKLRENFADVANLQNADGDAREELLPKPFWEDLEDCEYQDQNPGEQGFECALAMLSAENNRFGKKYLTKSLGQAQREIAQETLEQEQQQGDGFLAKTSDPENKNPFTKVIQSPGSSVQSVVEKTLNSTIDQTIVASDRCFGSVPQIVQDGTISPLLENGLFEVTQETRTAPDGSANTSSPGEEGIDFSVDSILDSLLGDLLGAIDCELQNEISTALDQVLDEVTNLFE